ncbi:MAG TPA: hypothetical protein VGD60_08960 [Candidatus Acidoferrales bacterium]
MGREVIGECSGEDEPGDCENGLIVKYLKASCGALPDGVDVQITSEGYEVGNEGGEISYPAVSVVWDDGVSRYPSEFISDCVAALERFDTPEEIYEECREMGQLLIEINECLMDILDSRRVGDDA